MEVGNLTLEECNAAFPRHVETLEIRFTQGAKRRQGGNHVKLKLACYSEVSKICKNVCKHNTLIGELEIDKQSKMLIAEFIWKKLQVYAEDLEAFAKNFPPVSQQLCLGIPTQYIMTEQLSIDPGMIPKTYIVIMIHAKRSTINIEDVKLLVRRNTSLVDRISKISEELTSIKESKKKKTVKESAEVMEVE